MRANTKPAVHICCLVAFCCLLSCCANRPHWTITVSEIPILTQEPTGRIPLRAGFFMDEKSEHIRYSGRGASLYQDYHQGDVRRNIDFDVRAAFEQVTRRMFQEVVPIAATDASEDWKKEDLDVVVFVGAPVCEVEFGHVIYTTFSAVWSVLSPDGGMITSVRPVGEGQVQPGGSAKEVLIAAVDAHIRDVYDNLVASAWWRDSSWKSN